MKRMGIFIGVVAFAFILTTFHVDNPVFANSCCGIEKVEKVENDGSKDGVKGGIMEVAAGENSGDNCPVCGQAADSKGQQKDVEHDGKTAHLCCEGCANEYNANPDKYSKSEEPM
jgi:YHS domain-containing protein